MTDSVSSQIRTQLLRLNKVKDQGRNIFICCPFPDHPDNSPSFSVYVGRYSKGGLPLGTGYCWGCGRTANWTEIAEMLNLNATLNGTVQAESISQDMKDNLLPRKLTLAMVMKDMKCEGKLPIETRKWRDIPKDLLKDMGCFYTDYVNLDLEIKERSLFLPCHVDGRLTGAIRAKLRKKEGSLSYINSPGSWSKNKGYFAFDYSHKTFDGDMPMIVVEGPRDAMVWVRDAYPATAILGSKVFSKEKARLLVNLGRPIILFFDGDMAGIQATNLVSSTLKEVLGNKYQSRVFIYKLVQRAMKILDLSKEDVLDLKLDPASLPDEVRRDFIKFYKRVMNK